MKKVFHFEAQRESYVCDAAVVWCFDSRFQIGFAKFLKRLGAMNIDRIKIAGGAKCLATPARESDREFILDQIQASMRLHATKLAILMVHSDCGAYGGLGAFQNNERLEAVHHEKELRKAAYYLFEKIPGLAVQAYFVDFEGVWEVEVSRPTLDLAGPERRVTAQS